jgi:hypothetical protein
MGPDQQGDIRYQTGGNAVTMPTVAGLLVNSIKSYRFALYKICMQHPQ